VYFAFVTSVFCFVFSNMTSFMISICRSYFDGTHHNCALAFAHVCSLSTIGFGDFYPDTENARLLKIFGLVWIYLGLSILGRFIHLTGHRAWSRLRRDETKNATGREGWAKSSNKVLPTTVRPSGNEPKLARLAEAVAAAELALAEEHVAQASDMSKSESISLPLGVGTDLISDGVDDDELTTTRTTGGDKIVQSLSSHDIEPLAQHQDEAVVASQTVTIGQSPKS
jgi:hypothetical protein